MKSKEAKIPFVRLWLLCFCLLLSIHLFSEDKYQFEKISTEQGLSQSVVLCILQDRQGFMWFGTQDGLNRYDGHDMVVFRHSLDDAGSIGDNFIQTLYEDEEGYIWVGTRIAGLDRFDPRSGTFSHFMSDPENPESLSLNHVTAIQEDSEGFLWIGTRGGGVNRFDKKNETFLHFRHNPEDPESLCHDNIRDLCMDRHERLWIGTEGGGLDLYDPDKRVFIHIGKEEDSSTFDTSIVIDIVEDESGKLMVASDRGLYIIEESPEASEKLLIKHFEHNPNDSDSLSHNVAFSLLNDGSGSLWIGTYGGGLNRISSEHLDRGLSRFEKFRHEPDASTSLSHDIILSLYEDRSGLLWVGTSGGGVNKAIRPHKPFVHVRCDPEDPNDLKHNFIFSLIEDQSGNLWVGTREGLCQLPEGADDRFHLYDSPKPSDLIRLNIIRSILQDRSGFLWIGTYSVGLIKLDKSTGEVKRFRPKEDEPASISGFRILGLLEDRSGNIWIGTEEGGLDMLPFSELEKDTPKFIHFRHDPENSNSLSSDHVLSLCEDKDRSIWVGTYGAGLNRLRRENQDRSSIRFERFVHDPENPSSLSSDLILAVHQSEDGTIWVGTSGGGLNELNEDHKTFTRYTEEDGLANNTIYGILEDSKQYLWLSSNKGLSRFDPRTGEFVNFDVSDGLQGDEFNRGAYFLGNRGRVYFGGVNGITAFDPEDIVLSTYKAPLVVTSIQTEGDNTYPGMTDFDHFSGDIENAIVLSAARPIVRLNFVSLDFTNPAKNRYAYKLVGRDQDWNNLGGQRELILSNLKAGRYKLRIKGSNSDGIWNEEGVSLSIKVVSPLWGRTWFVSLIGALGLFLALLFYKLYRKSSSAAFPNEMDIESVLTSHSISNREKEILQLLLKGKSNKEIGKELFISESTVKKHVYSIYQKLGVKNRLQIVSLLQKSKVE